VRGFDGKKILAMENVKREEKFQQQLQSLSAIENMLVEAMPQMIERSDNFGLKKSLALHFAETQQHKTAIDAICKQLDFQLNPDVRDRELDKILEQGKNAMSDQSDGNQLDAAIIAGALEIEQYELSAYESAAEMARLLGYEGIAQRLYLTFEEERQASTKLKFLESQLRKQVENEEPAYHEEY